MIIEDAIAGLIVAFVGQAGALWWKLGRVEAAAKHACPFGKCPMYERAKSEAAPLRKQPDGGTT